MEQEYRVDNYGIQEKVTGEVREVCCSLPDCFGVEWAGPDLALFAHEGAVYKKNPFSHPEEEKKRAFSRPGGSLVRLCRRGEIIVSYNSEGRIRLTDTQGNRLREIESGKSAIRSVAFLTDQYIASGGEACRLRIYSILEDTVVFEEEYRDYIESISGSDTYFAVALSSGDLHTYKYSTREVQEADTVQRAKSRFRAEREEVMSLGHAAKVLFVSDSELFIGLGTGAGYMYDIETRTLLSEVSMHSKAITSAQLHGEFLVTSSLDGKIRVSTKELREITSLHAGAPILALSAVFGEKGGSEYLISTSTGNVIAYRERWEKKEEKKEKKETPVFRSRTLYEAASSASTRPHSLLSLQPRDKQSLNEYEHLVRGFLYQKSLELAISKQDRYTVSSLLAYMHGVDRLSGALLAIPEESLAYVADICTFYLREKSFFPVSESVLKTCVDIMEKKLRASASPVFSELPRALQELEEECMVQSAFIALSEYIQCTILHDSIQNTPGKTP